MQTASANIFCVLVHTKSKVCNLIQGIVGEFQLEPLGFKQGCVLLDQRRLRLSKNADKVFHGERLQFHADRKAALQLRDQIAGLGDVKGARCNKQNMVGAHHAVTGVYGCALHNGKNIALHALAGNVSSVAALAAGDLITFIEENDARLLHTLDSDACHLVHIN